MRGMSNQKYHGRYTAQEFSVAKMNMLSEYRGELGVGKIDDVLRYCAKNDWPSDREETYRYAKTFAHTELVYLKYYDLAQDFLDRAHHGENFYRVWPEYDGVPESKREVDVEKLRLVAGSWAAGKGAFIIGDYSRYISDRSGG
jgi:hypothetical protein